MSESIIESSPVPAEGKFGSNPYALARDLKISVRLANIIANMGSPTLDAAAQITPYEFMKQRGAGKVSLIELCRVLDEAGVEHRLSEPACRAVIEDLIVDQKILVKRHQEKIRQLRRALKSLNAMREAVISSTSR